MNVKHFVMELKIIQREFANKLELATCEINFREQLHYLIYCVKSENQHTFDSCDEIILCSVVKLNKTYIISLLLISSTVFHKLILN